MEFSISPWANAGIIAADLIVLPCQRGVVACIAEENGEGLPACVVDPENGTLVITGSLWIHTEADCSVGIRSRRLTAKFAVPSPQETEAGLMAPTASGYHVHKLVCQL